MDRPRIVSFLHRDIRRLLPRFLGKRLKRSSTEALRTSLSWSKALTGMETLKAMAVEPQMERRWEEQLAGYVQASFRVVSLGNWASQAVQFINKVVTALTLYFGAHLVISGKLTVGELIAFNMLPAGLRAAGLAVGHRFGRTFIKPRYRSIGSAIFLMRRRSRHTIRQGSACRQSRATSFSIMSASAIGLTAPRFFTTSVSKIPAGKMIGIVGPSGSGKSTLTKARFSVFMSLKAAGCLLMG